MQPVATLFIPNVQSKLISMEPRLRRHLSATFVTSLEWPLNNNFIPSDNN